MKPKYYTYLTMLALFLSATANSATIQTNEQKQIVSIGSLSIGASLYDVSFDQTFGTMLFLGDQAGFAQAGSAITSQLNQLEDHPHFPWPFPVLAGGRTSFYVVFGTVDDGEPDFHLTTRAYESHYSAGWTSNVWDGFSVDHNLYEPTFRLAIPGSIPHTIPEPSSSFITALGAIGALVHRRRRKQRGEQAAS
jgi:hypothetical protein